MKGQEPGFAGRIEDGSAEGGPKGRVCPASAWALGSSALEVHVGDSIAEVEKRLILATLDQLRGDKKRAAQLLGISLKTLYNRLSVYAAAASARPGRPAD